MSFKVGVDYFVGSIATNNILELSPLSQEDLDAARRYMIRHGAEDLLEMMGL